MRSDLKSEQISRGSSQFVSAASLRFRLDWFNKLRWVAVAVVVVVVLIAGFALHIPLPVDGLLWTAACLLVLNLFYVVRNRRLEPVDIGAEIRLVKLQMVGDLVGLTVLLNLSGGIENPMLLVYVIHVIIASLLFRGREIFQITWLAIFLFTAEVAGEYFRILPHHHLLSASNLTHEMPFILMHVASFWLVMLVSAYVGATIMKHNRSIKDELIQRQEDLIQADLDKMEFFRFVTHEIKSPVNTAQSAVETALELGGSDLPEKTQDLLGRAVGRLEQATDIVKDLADLTRGGDIKPERLGDVDLGEVVRAEAEQLQPLAERKGLAFRLELPDTPPVVRSSRDMMEKIIGNLLSNAVRYSHRDGKVTVVLEADGGGVRLQVQDEGIGIPAEDHERIFEEFYRTAEARKLTNLGTGLGLPIVRKFVQRLGGSIGLVSAPGEGATFTVVLPLFVPAEKGGVR